VTAQNEVGRPLLATQLVERTVVCVRREDRDVMFTLWVEQIGADFVMFLAGASKPTIHFLAFRLPDGLLIDDAGRRILVYEYLGKV
jgi:hypothetical protein